MRSRRARDGDDCRRLKLAGRTRTQLIAELEAKLSPGPARCLVGSTVCLVTADDATGAVIRPPPGPAEEAGPWRVVACGECDAVLGADSPHLFGQGQSLAKPRPVCVLSSRN